MLKRTTYRLTQAGVMVETTPDNTRLLSLVNYDGIQDREVECDTIFHSPSDLILFINELKEIVDDWDAEILRENS